MPENFDNTNEYSVKILHINNLQMEIPMQTISDDKTVKKGNSTSYKRT